MRAVLRLAVAGAIAASTLTALTATPALADAVVDVKVNEVESNGDAFDWIELVNTGTEPADVSGFVLKDNSATNPGVTLASGSIIPAGGFLAVNTNDAAVSGNFGLGAADSARLFASDGTTLVDSYSWTAHAATTYGRCPNGTGEFVNTPGGSKAAANACAGGFDPASVRLNEIESNGDQVADWVELVNTGSAPADVSGWKLKDSGATNPFVTLPANTVIQPGGFVATYTEFPPPGFGLGVDDTVFLYQADGTSLVDSHAWTGGHAGTTYGRCPDGSGDWQETTVATRGEANACSPIRLNEIASDPNPDWVELVNLSGSDIDVAGWSIKDSGDTAPTTLPSPSIVPANGHLVVGSLAAGLGGADAARLFDASAKLIDSYSWTAHGVPSFGRCKDGVGAFRTTAALTPGAVNACPGLETEPWPGSQAVEVSDDVATFTQDASGVVFDPTDPNSLWVSQNKAGTLWKLTRSGDIWTPADGWTGGRNPRYADGTGAPDSEGLTIGPDGAVYLATERNNDVSGVSRNAVLRYEPGTSMSATDEWSLNSLLPTLGANLGLEGITWIPDTHLTDGGFVDQSTTEAYDPADYANHGDGLYVVAVEGTGMLYVLALEQTAAVHETAHLVATLDPKLQTNAGPPGAMDVTWDPEQERLWAVCDDSCDGVTVTMALDDLGAFAVAEAFDRPLGMPNLNNEGLALAPQSTCVDDIKQVVWTDDGDTDGHSLRTGTIGCTAKTETPTETPTGEPTQTPTGEPAPAPTQAPGTAPATTPSTGLTSPTVPQVAATKVEVRIMKPARRQRIIQRGSRGRLTVVVTARAGAELGRVRIRVWGNEIVRTVELDEFGRAAVRLPRLTQLGRRTLVIRYLGSDDTAAGVRRLPIRVT